MFLYYVEYFMLITVNFLYHKALFKRMSDIIFFKVIPTPHLCSVLHLKYLILVSSLCTQLWTSFLKGPFAFLSDSRFLICNFTRLLLSLFKHLSSKTHHVFTHDNFQLSRLNVTVNIFYFLSCSADAKQFDVLMVICTFEPIIYHVILKKKEKEFQLIINISNRLF